ncbi:MAG: phenylacetate--CoA ligase family protein, partial [Vicinamibacterales bacterium]
FERVRRARFRRTIELAARSRFYGDAFRRLGIDPRRVSHPSDLGDFFTTGEDLRQNGPDAFIVGRADTAFETTGTTSPLPKRVYFSNRELDAMGSSSAAALHLLGVRREDRVVSAFDCSFWVSPAVARSALQYIGCFHVEAGKIAPAEFYDRAHAYQPTILFGEPSWIVRLSEIAAARGAWPLKLLLAGGENIAETARREIERVWRAPLYLNYGQTEAFGSLGLECRERQGYHRNDLHFLFEIDRPDASGAGELVYTTLTREVMPLVRYRASDITRLIEEPCGCGLFVKRIEKIRARADEMVVCGMGNVGPWVFEELLRGIVEPGADWQATLGHSGQRDTMELRIETAGSDGDALERAVFASLRERFPDFWKNFEMRLYELRVTPVPRGTLRTGRKLRRILDARQLAAAAR